MPPSEFIKGTLDPTDRLIVDIYNREILDFEEVTKEIEFYLETVPMAHLCQLMDAAKVPSLISKLSKGQLAHLNNYRRYLIPESDLLLQEEKPEPVKEVIPPKQNDKYIIVKLSDAKVLAQYIKNVKAFLPPEIRKITNRIEAESGADIENIVSLLKRLNFCHACVIEGQEHSCEIHYAKKYGRRLSRLVDRANYITPKEPLA